MGKQITGLEECVLKKPIIYRGVEKPVEGKVNLNKQQIEQLKKSGHI